MLWLSANRERIKSELNTDKVTLVSKEAGRQWKGLSEADKAEFQQEAAVLKERYLSDVESYKAQGNTLPARKKKGTKEAAAAKESYLLWLSAAGDWKVYSEADKQMLESVGSKLKLKVKAKKGAKKKSKAQTKRPPSAYVLWVKEHYGEIKESMPSAKPTEVMKEAAARWKQLPEHEKASFTSRAEALQQEYKQQKGA